MTQKTTRRQIGDKGDMIMSGDFFTDVLGIRTHYVSTGGGPLTVVLLHGGGIDCARLSWGALLPALTEKMRVVAPDWPGYGESEHYSGTYSMEFLINFLEAFLNQLEIDRAMLVGISMGGAASLGFTLRCPERVEKLVLVDSYGLQRKAPWHAFSYLYVKLPGINTLTWKSMRFRSMVRWSLNALLKRPGALNEDLVDLAVLETNRPGAGKAFTSFQNDEVTWSGLRTCYIDQLSEIKASTLIVHGTLDNSVPTDCAREAHIRIKGSSLHWMEGCGHWSQRDNPQEFQKVIERFLQL